MKKPRITEKLNGEYRIRDDARYSMAEMVNLAGKYEESQTLGGRIATVITLLILWSVILLLILGIKTLIVAII